MYMKDGAICGAGERAYMFGEEADIQANIFEKCPYNIDVVPATQAETQRH